MLNSEKLWRGTLSLKRLRSINLAVTTPPDFGVIYKVYKQWLYIFFQVTDKDIE